MAVEVPRTHDLERLAALLGDAYPEFSQDIPSLAILSPWGVLTRYPQLESDLGIGEDDVRRSEVAVVTTDGRHDGRP